MAESNFHVGDLLGQITELSDHLAQSDEMIEALIGKASDLNGYYFGYFAYAQNAQKWTLRLPIGNILLKYFNITQANAQVVGGVLLAGTTIGTSKTEVIITTTTSLTSYADYLGAAELTFTRKTS